jgi:hypothetical protein
MEKGMDSVHGSWTMSDAVPWSTVDRALMVAHRRRAGTVPWCVEPRHD